MTKLKLSEQAIRDGMASIESWRIRDGKLYREFDFRNFVEAFGFMTQAALVSERMGHHPEWSNVYRRVTVSLTTHDAQGVTEADFALARAMDQIALQFLG